MQLLFHCHAFQLCIKYKNTIIWKDRNLVYGLKYNTLGIFTLPELLPIVLII